MIMINLPLSHVEHGKGDDIIASVILENNILDEVTDKPVSC